MSDGDEKPNALEDLRKGLGLYINFRPIRVREALIGISPLRPESAAIAAGRTSMAHRCGFTPGALQRCFNELPYGEVLLRRRSAELELVAVARAIPARNDAERAALMSALGL